MINTVKYLALIILVGCILPSVTLHVDSKTTASIEGTYEGILTYTSAEGKVIATIDGTATIIKTEDTYTIKFSNKVPSLTGLKFVNNDGAYVTTKSSSSIAGIAVDEEDLSISARKDGNTWAFTGEK